MTKLEKPPFGEHNNKNAHLVKSSDEKQGICMIS